MILKRTLRGWGNLLSKFIQVTRLTGIRWQEDFFLFGQPIFFHQPEEGCCISSGYVFVFSLFMVAKLYVKFVGDDQDQGAGEEAQAQGAGEDASAQGAGEDEQAPDAGGDGHHSGQG